MGLIGEYILYQIRKGKEQIIQLDAKNYEVLRKVNGKYEKIGVLNCRITNQSGGVYGKDGSLDANTLNTSLYVLAKYNADIKENDRLKLGRDLWTIGAVSKPTPAGSVYGNSCIQATLIYNGKTNEN